MAQGFVLLLGDLLTQLAPDALPADQTQQIPWVNAVCSRFFSVGKWAGTTVRWKGTTAGVSFNIQYDANGQGFITLPRGLLSLLAGAYGQTTPGQTPSPDVRFSNAEIQGPWAEFGNGGYGVGDTVLGSGIFDAGDDWTTFADITENSYLRVVTEEVEKSGATVLFQGLDGNQQEIYTGSGAGTIHGVQLDISTSLTTQTTQIFSAAPDLVEKPVTYGPISLYAVSVVSGTATLIASYAPGETSPGYRRYKLGGAILSPGQTPPFTTLHAMAKRRFVPVATDADEVIPGSVQAIELGMNGRRYDLQGDPKTAMEYWGPAFALLNAELNEFNGAAVPRIIWQKGTNLAGMPRI